MAASRIKGITIEIGGDTTKLQTALKGVNTEIRNTQAQLKDVEKLLKLDPGNTELLAQKHKLLGDAVKETKEKLETLKTAAEQAEKALNDGTISKDQYDALQREIIETENELKRLEEQANQSATALQKISATGEKLKDVGSNIEGAGKKLLPVTATVTALGTASVKTAADFEAAMSKVAAVSGTTGSDLEALSKKAREMGSKTKFSASEAAEAMNYMAMAGWKTEDMLSGIEGVMNLAAASGEDLAKPLDNGYRFVWEFTPSQGNGTIAAVALTSKQGGVAAYGSMENSKAAFYQIMETRLETQTVEELAELFSAVEVDFENNILISMRFQDSSVIVHKRRLPVFTLGLNDTTNDLLEEKVIHCSTFKFLGSYTPYGDFLDGHDGYWYGFANQANSSGDAKMYWAKIKKDDYTMTEGIWTLSNCYLKAIGYFKVDTYAQRGVRGVIRNGYLYLTANNDEGIYKINLSNSTDVTLIPFGFTSEGKSQTGSGTCANYLFMVNDLIIGWDYQIKPDDTVVQTVGSTRLLNLGTPLFQYKEFCFGWGGNYGSDYRMCFLLTPYLASINNLSTAVVKTTDKTMKITYELTEVDS